VFIRGKKERFNRRKRNKAEVVFIVKQLILPKKEKMFSLAAEK
jgi:hypothetical protein